MAGGYIPVIGLMIIGYENTITLQAGAGNYEDFVHGLGNQFVTVTILVKPPSGTYQDTWINGEGMIVVVYFDANTLRIYNENGEDLEAGRVRVLVVG